MMTPMPKKQKAMTKEQFTNLFREMEAAGYTPQQIADGLGVGRTSMYRWLNGTRKIDKFTAQAIVTHHDSLTKKKK